MKIILSSLFLVLSSCALIERSQQARTDNANASPSSDRFSNQPQQKPKVIVKRTYIDAFKDSTKGSSKYSDETTRYAYELGFDPQTSLTPTQMKAIEQRKQVRELERRLDSNKEREQYSKVLPLLNDNEKVEFLSIPSLEGRQTWINKNSIPSRAKAPTPAMKEAMETQDITLQMPMDYVRKAWGEPNAIEVSGNPIYKNERWKYLRYVATPDGYRSEKRYVYFESGKVVGWETE